MTYKLQRELKLKLYHVFNYEFKRPKLDPDLEFIFHKDPS